MNGFSDVRLALHTQELDESGSKAANTIHARKAELPAGMNRWALYAHLWTTRRSLLQLTSDELRDIGLDPLQARAEALKPFWR